MSDPVRLPLISDFGGAPPAPELPMLMKGYPEWSGNPMLAFAGARYQQLREHVATLRERFVQNLALIAQAQGPEQEELEMERQALASEIGDAQFELEQMEATNPALAQPVDLGDPLPLIEKGYERDLAAGNTRGAERGRQKALDLVTAQEVARQQAVDWAEELTPRPNTSMFQQAQRAPTAQVPTPQPRPNTGMFQQAQRAPVPQLQMGITGRATPTAPPPVSLSATRPMTGGTMPIATPTPVASRTPQARPNISAGLPRSMVGMAAGTAPASIDRDMARNGAWAVARGAGQGQLQHLVDRMFGLTDEGTPESAPEETTMPEPVGAWAGELVGEPGEDIWSGLGDMSLTGVPELVAKRNAAQERLTRAQQESRRGSMWSLLANAWGDIGRGQVTGAIGQGTFYGAMSEDEGGRALESLDARSRAELAQRQVEQRQWFREAEEAQAEIDALDAQYPFLPVLAQSTDPVGMAAAVKTDVMGGTAETDTAVEAELAAARDRQAQIGAAQLGQGSAVETSLAEDMALYEDLLPKSEWEELREAGATDEQIARAIRLATGSEQLQASRISEAPMDLRGPMWQEYYNQHDLSWPGAQGNTYTELPGQYTPGQLGPSLQENSYADALNMQTEAERQWELEQAHREAQLAQQMEIAQMEAALQQQQMGAQVGQTVADLVSQNWQHGLGFALPKGTKYAPGFERGGAVNHLAQMAGRRNYQPFEIAPNNPPSAGELMGIVNQAIAGFQ